MSLGKFQNICKKGVIRQTPNYIQKGFGKIDMGNNSQQRSIEPEKDKNAEHIN